MSALVPSQSRHVTKVIKRKRTVMSNGAETIKLPPVLGGTEIASVLSEIAQLEKTLATVPVPSKATGFRLGPEFQTEKHRLIAQERLQDLRRELARSERQSLDVKELGFRRFVGVNLPSDAEMLYSYMWELEEALKKDLIWIGTREYLYTALRGELQPGEYDDPTWHEYFGYVDPSKLPGFTDPSTGDSPGPTPPQRELAIRHLLSLYEARTLRERIRRTRIAVKGQYLQIVSQIMLLALLGFFAVIIFMTPSGPNTDQPRDILMTRLEIILVALAGALGAMLMHLLRARDEMTRIRELFAGSLTMFAQPLIGATSALVLWLILKTGFIAIGQAKPGDASWEVATVFGFLAGFSEPFFLNTLNRFAGSPDATKKESQPASK